MGLLFFFSSILKKFGYKSNIQNNLLMADTFNGIRCQKFYEIKQLLENCATGEKTFADKISEIFLKTTVIITTRSLQGMECQISLQRKAQGWKNQNMIHCVLKTQCLGKQRLGLSSAYEKDNPGFSSLARFMFIIYLYILAHTCGSCFTFKRIFVTHKCVSMYISYVSFVFFLFFLFKEKLSEQSPNFSSCY